MDRLIFTSHSAISEAAIARSALVNEMANVSTVGFKRSFDVALRSIKVDGPGFDTRYQTQAVARDVIDLQPGALMMTGRPMDIAMQGKTVMGVQSSAGELAFSRRGDLRLNAQGVLEDGSGHMVMGQGGPITAPAGFHVNINPDGTVYASNPGQPNAAPVQIGQLMLRDASEAQLVRRADGLYGPAGQPPGSDFTTGPKQPLVTPNALEGSNVNAIYAMTRLIDHSRSFEAQIRAIKEAKSLDESGATMLKNT